MPWERRAFYANGSDTRIGFSLGRGRRRLPLLDHDVEGDECALDAAAVDAVLDGFLRDVVGDAVRAQHLEPLGQVEAAGRIRRHALEADLAFLADDDRPIPTRSPSSTSTSSRGELMTQSRLIGTFRPSSSGIGWRSHPDAVRSSSPGPRRVRGDGASE